MTTYLVGHRGDDEPVSISYAEMVDLLRRAQADRADTGLKAHAYLHRALRVYSDETAFFEDNPEANEIGCSFDEFWVKHIQAGDLPAQADAIWAILQQEPPEAQHCGTCKSTPCLVDAGTICCHDMVRYGWCAHEPLYQ